MSLISMEQMEALIKEEQYHHFPNTTMTVCVLTLQNGYHVSGESACVHKEDFDAALGKKYARDMAVKKIFDVEAYMLKQKEFCFGAR